MLIPGEIISLLTFPGVIVHEVAHQLFCRLYRVAVFEVCYIRFGNPSGYVTHEVIKGATAQVMVGVGPFFLNSILGALIASPGAVAVFNFEAGSAFDYFLVWLGLSIAMHAFPSRGDAKSIWAGIKKRPLPVKIIVAPIVALIYIGSFGSMVWLDLIYGVGLAMIVPNLIVKMLA